MDTIKKDFHIFARTNNISNTKKSNPSKNSNTEEVNDGLIAKSFVAGENQLLSCVEPFSDIKTNSSGFQCIKNELVNANGKLKTDALNQAEIFKDDSTTTSQSVQVKLTEAESQPISNNVAINPPILQFGQSPTFLAVTSHENNPMRISDTHFNTIQEHIKAAFSKRPSKVAPYDIIKSHLKMLYKKVYSSKNVNLSESFSNNVHQSQGQELERNKRYRKLGKHPEGNLSISDFSYEDAMSSTQKNSTSPPSLQESSKSLLEKVLSEMHTLIDPFDSKNPSLLEDEAIEKVVSKLSVEYNDENAESRDRLIEEIFSSIAITQLRI